MSTARLGLIVPSSNTVAEPDFYRHLSRGATLHTARMYLEQTTPEAEATMLDHHLPQAVADIATSRPDVVVFACTSAGTLRGNEAEQQLIEQISERTNAGAISVAKAVRDAIAQHSARRVAVITPYLESLNEKIRSSLEQDGLEVKQIHGMKIEQNLEIGRVDPEQIIEFALTHVKDTSEVDLLFASCTNWRALEARGQIEQRLGIPVVTSNHAALAAATDRLSARWPRAPIAATATPHARATAAPGSSRSAAMS